VHHHSDVPVVPAQVGRNVKSGSLMTVDGFVDSQAWALKGGEWMDYCAPDDLATSGTDDEEEEVLGMSDSSD